MNIRKLVATGILGVAALTGCDAYNNTQRVFAREAGITTSPSKEQEAQSKSLEAQRNEIARQKALSLDNIVDDYAGAKNAYNDYIECNPDEAPLAEFKGFNKPIYAKHDVLIRKTVNKWNDYFSKRVSGYKALDPNFAKAVMLTESGSVIDAESWNNDPMSLAHAGDIGFEALVKKDAAHLVEGNLYLGKLARTPRKDGKWDYTFTPAEGKHKITAEESIDEGIHLLIHKGLKFTYVKGSNLHVKENKDGSRECTEFHPVNGLEASFLGWDEAAKRYNGGGDKQYVKKVQEKMKSIKIDLK